MRQPRPLCPTPSDCHAYERIPAMSSEPRRAQLEAELARDLARALRRDQNVVFHHACGPSPQRAADFVRECGNAQADDLFAQTLAHTAQPDASDAALASLMRRWLTLSAAQAVQILANAIDDRQRVTFEARQ